MTEPQGWKKLFHNIEGQIASLQRTVTSSQTGFPVRENLLPEALYVFPADTPVLNRLEVLQGAGLAAAWKEVTGHTITGTTPHRIFYTEGGTPTDSTSDFEDQSAAYKLMGLDFGVTGFARAAGMNFQDALVAERESTIIAMKLDIENALINADSSVEALAFDGLVKQIDAGNGSYIDSAAAAIDLDRIKDAFRGAYERGYQVDYMLMNGVDAQNVNDLVLAAGTHSITVIRENQGDIHGSGRVSHFIDPLTGKPVEIVPSRYLAAKTILGIPETLPFVVKGRQGRRGIWLDELLPFTEMEQGVVADAMNFFMKTYAVLAFPARRGAFKIVDTT